MERPNDLDPEMDPAELRFRLDSVPAGAWVTFIICAAGLAYSVAWDHDHETTVLLLIGAGGIGAGVVLALPWERIIRSRHRELAFATWSVLDVGLLIALAALSGGGDSPFAVLLVITIIFAAVSFPRWLVLVIGAIVVTAYVVLAVATSTPGDYTLLVATALVCTAIMGDWQARNHGRRRELLALASQTDPLTGSLNRRGFQLAAAALLASVSRLSHSSSLVLLDLDNFKAFNDAHGHAAGDELLCWTVERIRGSLRPTDSLARLGGDEFAVLLAGADRPAAQAAVLRISTDLAPRVEVSCGLASAPADGDEIEALYHRADAELYEAKRSRTGAGVVSRLRQGS